MSRLILGMFLGCWTLVLSAQEASALALARQRFQESTGNIDANAAEEKGRLAEAYSANLLRLAASAQSTGDLNAYLALMQEQKAFSVAGTLPETEAQHPVPDVRQTYGKALQAIELKRQNALRDLTGSYLRFLEAGVAEMTRSSRIEEALAYREEMRKIQESAAGVPVAETAPDPVGLSPVPAQPDAVRISWPGAGGPASLDLSPPGMAKAVSISHLGANRFRARGMECLGGISNIDGVEAGLANACRISGELSILLSFETGDENQSGPARILSFSLDGAQRNFTLGQQGNRLVFRLRTTESGENGTRPEVGLGTLSKGSRTKVAVTYAAETLRAFVNGKELSLQSKPQGDFSNWSADCKLVVGNEASLDRPWEGMVHAFIISSQAISAEESLAWTR